MALRMLKLKSLRTQRGDTILEVLIATAVLTLVLTIAYTAANRGTHAIRQAQERGEASRYTETQIEQLKTFLSQSATPTIPPSGTKFCMKNDGTPVTITGAIDSNAQNENFSEFSPPALADCQKNGLYYSYIERNGDTFIAHTRWTRVNGKGIDESTMVHRIFPDLASGAINITTLSPGCPVDFYYNAVGGCTPCPTGFSSPGGFSTACAPIPAQVIVKVQKIPPVGSTSPDCSSPGNDANGVSVRLNGSGGPYDGTSTALFNVAFSSNYTASILTMPNGFVYCSTTPASVTSTPIGTAPIPPGNNQRTIAIKIKPTCDTIVTTYEYRYEFNGTYTPVVTSYAPYWSQGWRRGDLDTIGPTAVYGTTSETIVADSRSGTGYTWYYWSGNYGYIGGTHYSWYAAWEAIWNPNPQYTYYPNYQWNAYPIYTATCES